MQKLCANYVIAMVSASQTATSYE